MAVDIKDTFEIASGIKKDNTIDEFPKQLSEEQKKVLFIDAIKATYSRYGAEQALTAIKAIISNGNYDLITNGITKIKYRNLLKKSVSKEEVERIIRTTMERLNPDYTRKNIFEIADAFVDFFFNQDVAIKYYESCIVTYERYGSEWLKNAIYAFLNYGNPKGFSRYLNDENTKINYRQEIIKMRNDECIMAMKKYLRYMGSATSTLKENELINLYVDTLGHSRYESVESTSKMIV